MVSTGNGRPALTQEGHVVRNPEGAQLNRDLFPLESTNLRELAKVPDVSRLDGEPVTGRAHRDQCIVGEPRPTYCLETKSSSELVENRAGHAPIGHVRDQQPIDGVEFSLEPSQCLSGLSIRSADQQLFENDGAQPQRQRIGFGSTSGATRTQDKLITAPERRNVHGSVENNGRQAGSLPREAPEDVFDHNSTLNEPFSG